MNKSELPSYHDLEVAMIKANALISVPHAHGLMTGFLCTGGQVTQAQWLKAIIPTAQLNSHMGDVCTRMLAAHCRGVQNCLAGFGYEFQLLLPADDEPMEVRVDALVDWCRGFISGLGINEAAEGLYCSDELEEALSDIEAVAQLNIVPDEDTETNERHLMSVIEHIRMSVIMSHTELRFFSEEDNLEEIVVH